MKIRLVFSILVIVSMFTGCSHTMQTLPIERSTGNITFDGKKYYIIAPEDLYLGDMPLRITYLGSLDEYHLFRSWEKMRHTNEISAFAVSRVNCVVYDECDLRVHTLQLCGCKFRTAKIDSGKCVIDPCEK